MFRSSFVFTAFMVLAISITSNAWADGPSDELFEALKAGGATVSNTTLSGDRAAIEIRVASIRCENEEFQDFNSCAFVDLATRRYLSLEEESKQQSEAANRIAKAVMKLDANRGYSKDMLMIRNGDRSDVLIVGSAICFKAFDTNVTQCYVGK